MRNFMTTEGPITLRGPMSTKPLSTMKKPMAVLPPLSLYSLLRQSTCSHAWRWPSVTASCQPVLHLHPEVGNCRHALMHCLPSLCRSIHEMS